MLESGLLVKSAIKRLQSQCIARYGLRGTKIIKKINLLQTVVSTQNTIWFQSYKRDPVTLSSGIKLQHDLVSMI